MKIIVTGCMGFIGSNLVSHLLNSGHQVVGIDSLIMPSIDPTDRMKAKSGNNWPNFKFYEADIRDRQMIRNIFQNERPDQVVHLAALGSVPRSFKNPVEVNSVNVLGFINVMQFSSWVNCKRFIFASSSSVYGDDMSPTRDESKIGNPLSPYALSKRQNEQFAEIYCTQSNMDMTYIGLRFFNVYGAGQLPNSPYSAVIPKFLNEKQIQIFGDGETTRDFTYVDDVCEAIELSLTTEHTNDIYNVGTGHPTSLKQLANYCGANKEVIFMGSRPNDVKHSLASPYKAQLRLKFSASYDIERGIEYTKKYYESLKGIHTV